MEKYLDELKNEYKKTNATLHLRLKGWDELEPRLLSQEPVRGFNFRPFALAFALMLIFVLGLAGMVRVSEASVPGDALYPVKILSESVVKRATGDNQIVINHRAEEIAVLSKKEEVDRNRLEEVVNEYVESVAEAKERIEVSGEPDLDFQKKLDEHHERFDEIERENPRVSDEIRGAQEASNHSKDDKEED